MPCTSHALRKGDSVGCKGRAMTSDFEWDPQKAKANVELRGIDFDTVSQLDWTTAQMFVDDRKDYGEERLMVRGFIGNRLHILICVMRSERLRVISLRKANMRERRAYASETGRPL
jgi:uncharacterized protein